MLRATKQQLKRIIREQLELPSPESQAIIDQMENLSIDDLRAIWRAVAGTVKRKQNELKAGFKKGDRVAWTRKDGTAVEGTVSNRGGKYVMVIPDGDHRKWKKWPSSLRRIE